jgi:hypothetical protein
MLPSQSDPSRHEPVFAFDEELDSVDTIASSQKLSLASCPVRFGRAEWL